MEITFKVVLDRRYERQDKSCPLKIRIYKGRSYKERTLNIFVAPMHWNEMHQIVLESHQEAIIYNGRIAEVKTKVFKHIMAFDILNAGVVEPEEVLEAVFGKVEGQSNIRKKQSIIHYGNGIIAELTKSGRIGNAIVYSTAINKLRQYVKNDNFTFEQLTYKFLNEVNANMLADGIKVNTISIYMRTIRAIYNRAIKEGVASQTNYPFNAFRIKNERTVNRVLTIADMQKIIAHPVKEGTYMWNSRNYFLLSFCLIGINFSDLFTLRVGDIANGRVSFRRKKTHKLYSILLQPKALEILSYYVVNGANKDDYLLPVLKPNLTPVELKRDITQAIHVSNDNLQKLAKQCGAPKSVTTYYARYTWANIARSLGYSKDIIGQALGHSYGNAVTSIYLDDFDNAVIDEANSKVIAAVFDTT